MYHTSEEHIALLRSHMAGVLAAEPHVERAHACLKLMLKKPKKPEAAKHIVRAFLEEYDEWGSARGARVRVRAHAERDLFVDTSRCGRGEA